MTNKNTSARIAKAERRAARKAAARKQAQRQKMLVWGGITAVVVIGLVVMLVLMNQGNDLPDAIDYDTVAAEGRFLGDPDAPVDFVIYSDFQCPFCKLFEERDFPLMVENFVKSGDVRVEWRPLPIIANAARVSMNSPENESVQAAEAAMCAADQNQFWPYSAALYHAQGTENSGIYNDDMLISTAGDVGMDTDSFEACLTSDEKHEEVLKSHQEAFSSGIMATPTFLINGQQVSYSAEGYALLEKQLNAALVRKEEEDGQ